MPHTGVSQNMSQLQNFILNEMIASSESSRPVFHQEQLLDHLRNTRFSPNEISDSLVLMVFSKLNCNFDVKAYSRALFYSSLKNHGHDERIETMYKFNKMNLLTAQVPMYLHQLKRVGSDDIKHVERSLPDDLVIKHLHTSLTALDHASPLGEQGLAQL